MESLKATPCSEELRLSAVPKRNNKVDVLKGIAIICMVTAHCGNPYTNYIYLFHMAVFFMASGYFYNVKNSATLKDVAKYTLKKIRALYIPYVIFNGILVLLNNFFVDINIYTYDPAFLEIGGFGAVWGLKWPYTPEFTRAVLVNVLRMEQEPQLAGANWFLRVLFYVSIGHCVIMWLLQKIKLQWLRTLAMTVVVCACSIAAIQVQNGTLVMSDLYKMLFSCYLAYLLGIFLRKVEYLIRYDLLTVVISFALLYLLDPLGDISLNVGWIHTLGFYLVCSLLGWVLLRSVAELTSGIVASFLAYAGRYSMSIVFLHFLSFKLVTLIVILLRGDSMLLLASFPQLDGSEKGLWIAYTIIGTVVPLLLNAGYLYIKQKILGFMKNTVKPKFFHYRNKP